MKKLFKIACLNYQSGDVSYKGINLSRKTLIKLTEELIQSMHDKLMCDETFSKMLHPSSTGQQNASPIANFSKYKNQETGMAPFNNQRLRKGDIIKEYY